MRGFRSSCDRVARNTSFKRVAVTASARAASVAAPCRPASSCSPASRREGRLLGHRGKAGLLLREDPSRMVRADRAVRRRRDRARAGPRGRPGTRRARPASASRAPRECAVASRSAVVKAVGSPISRPTLSMPSTRLRCVSASDAASSDTATRRTLFGRGAQALEDRGGGVNIRQLSFTMSCDRR